MFDSAIKTQICEYFFSHHGDNPSSLVVRSELVAAPFCYFYFIETYSMFIISKRKANALFPFFLYQNRRMLFPPLGRIFSKFFCLKNDRTTSAFLCIVSAYFFWFRRPHNSPPPYWVGSTTDPGAKLRHSTRERERELSFLLLPVILGQVECSIFV